MSIRNILKEETQKEEWAKVYVNELNAERVDAKEGVLRGDGTGWVSRAAASPVMATGVYPVFAPLVNASWNSANLRGDLYVPALEEVKVRDDGLYQIHGYLKCEFAAATPAAYLAIKRNGVVEPLGVETTQYVAAGGYDVGLWVSQDVALVAGDTVSLGVSTIVAAVNITPKLWRLEFIKLR